MWSFLLLAQAASMPVEPVRAADQLKFPVDQPQLEMEANTPPDNQEPRYSTLEDLLGGVNVELTFGDLARYSASFRFLRW